MLGTGYSASLRVSLWLFLFSAKLLFYGVLFIYPPIGKRWFHLYRIIRKLTKSTQKAQQASFYINKIQKLKAWDINVHYWAKDNLFKV